MSLVNAVYYPNWRIYNNQPPSCLNIETVTHVFYAFASLDEDGNIFLNDENADCQISVDGVDGCLRAWTQMRDKNYPEMRVILSVGGAGAGGQIFDAITSDPIKTERFARSAKALVDQFSLDGIDGMNEIP